MTNVYHFRGTYNYGNTKAGAYMREQDSVAEGMRAARKMKSTLDTSLRSKAPQNRLSSTVHLNRPPYLSTGGLS